MILDCITIVSLPYSAMSVAEFPVIASDRERPIGAYVAYASICILWGTTFVAIRVAIETIPTLLVTGVRFVTAGLILLGVAALTGARFPRRAHEWRDHIISGVLMVA